MKQLIVIPGLLLGYIFVSLVQSPTHTALISTSTSSKWPVPYISPSALLVVSEQSPVAPIQPPQPPPAPVVVADPIVQPVPAPEPPIAPTTHESIMAQAGIDPSDYAAANQIIMWESSWNPYSVERNSGACNLLQELPCGKSGCSVEDEVCELSWGTSYVNSRYGGWKGALAFHESNGWY